MHSDDVVLISGYAKLPAHITSEEIYKVLVVVTVVDMATGVIAEAEYSVVTEVSKHFLAKMMLGYNMNDGPDALFARLDKTYFGQAKRAVATALKMIFAKYSELTGAGRAE